MLLTSCLFGLLLTSTNAVMLEKRAVPRLPINPIRTKLESFMTSRNSFDTDLNSISKIYLTRLSVATKKSQILPYMNALGAYQTAMRARIQEVVAAVAVVLPYTKIATIRALFLTARPKVPDYKSALLGTAFAAPTVNLTKAFVILDAMQAELAVKNGAKNNAQKFYDTFTEVIVPAPISTKLQSSMETSASLMYYLSLLTYEQLDYEQAVQDLKDRLKLS